MAFSVHIVSNSLLTSHPIIGRYTELQTASLKI